MCGDHDDRETGSLKTSGRHVDYNLFLLATFFSWHFLFLLVYHEGPTGQVARVGLRVSLTWIVEKVELGLSTLEGEREDL